MENQYQIILINEGMIFLGNIREKVWRVEFCRIRVLKK